MSNLLSYGPSPFDSIRQIGKDGKEFWSARDLQELLGYSKWQAFEDAIDRARYACKNAGSNPDHIFIHASKLQKRGDRGATQEAQDYHLTRQAVLLVLLNADIKKSEVMRHILYLVGATLAQYPDFHREAARHGVHITQDIVVRIEQRTIQEIVNAFTHFHTVVQYRVGKYHVDLYFTKQKIVVECDEKHHRKYDTKSEIERQAYIEQQLGCRFIRYHPDRPGFSIGTVIHQIMALIYEY
jgi:very-short-patch-repair endonuclease